MLLGCKTVECSPSFPISLKLLPTPTMGSSSCEWPPRYKKAYVAWLLKNSGVFPIIADPFEAIANLNNGLMELRVASQVLYKKAYIASLQNS